MTNAIMTTRSRVALAALLSVALRAGAQAPATPSKPADAMAAWKPPVVKHAADDRREVEALLKRLEAATTKGDLDAAAALVDFPVLMVTDDSKGEASGESWSRDQWVSVMKPMFARPEAAGATTHGRPTIVLLSDSLAMASTPWTMKMGARKVSSTSGLVVIRKGGAWMVKAEIEGGWGDLAKAGAPAQGAAQPSSGQ